MANIYELTGELLALMDLADEEDLDPQALADTLEGLEGEFDEKVDGWCKAVKNLEAEQKALKEESKRLAERAKKTENNIKHTHVLHEGDRQDRGWRTFKGKDSAKRERLAFSLPGRIFR